MKRLLWGFDKLVDVMHVISGILLCSMVCITLYDVSTRLVFKFTSGSLDWTLRGAVELISYGLLMTMLFAFPYWAHQSQIIVELFTEKMSAKSKHLLEAIYHFAFVMLAFGMGRGFLHAYRSSYLSQETTQDLLIPMHYIHFIAMLACFILATRMLLISVQYLTLKGGEKIA